MNDSICIHNYEKLLSKFLIILRSKEKCFDGNDNYYKFSEDNIQFILKDECQCIIKYMMENKKLKISHFYKNIS